MEKQKTAVEFLIQEIRKNRIVIPMEMEQKAKEMEKAEKIKAQIDVLSLLNDTHPLRINIMIRKLKEQLKSLTFKSE
jgi:hypothetical protein